MNRITKNREIAKILRSQILSGKIPEGKLPGERVLCEQFQVARNTVRAALDILEQEDLIRRKRRTGTTVCPTPDKSRKSVVALVLRTTGHLYEDRYRCLQDHFLKAGYEVCNVSVHVGPYQRSKAVKKRQNQAFEALFAEKEPDLIVYDNEFFMLESFQKKIQNIDTIALDYPVCEFMFDRRGVWNDYRMAGYLGAKFLLESGSKRPMILTHFHTWRQRFLSRDYERHRDKVCVEGFRQALTEAGIDPEPLIISPQVQSLQEYHRFFAAFTADESLIPDGFFGTSDYNVSLYMKHLSAFHGAVPEHIRFLGIGNTPWSQTLPHRPFSSIWFDYDEIAENVIRMAETKPEDRTDVYIPAKITVR